LKHFIKLKKRIKKNEGYRDKAYLDVLGFATIGYGHLIKKNENYLLKNHHSKSSLLKIFEIDFEESLTQYLRTYGNKRHKKNVKEVYIEMIFQLGLENQLKFIKMDNNININKYYMAAFEMKNSLWYKQTPKRVDFLINILLKNKYEKKR
jgi:GH24 family phage-related lysozyme (muramidase)